MASKQHTGAPPRCIDEQIDVVLGQVGCNAVRRTGHVKVISCLVCGNRRRVVADPARVCVVAAG